MNRFFVAIVSTVTLIHLALLLYKPDKPVEPPPKANPPQSVRVKLLDPASEENPNNSKGIGQTLAKECKSWYYGVGIVHDRFTGVVSEVGKGSPAAAAGIKPGDGLVDILDELGNSTMNSRDYKDVKYKGRLAIVIIIRDGKSMNFKLYRDKICTEEG